MQDFVVILLDAFYADRHYARFYVLETIARVPYFCEPPVLPLAVRRCHRMLVLTAHFTPRRVIVFLEKGRLLCLWIASHDFLLLFVSVSTCRAVRYQKQRCNDVLMIIWAGSSLSAGQHGENSEPFIKVIGAA
jgi:hypothetical protein